jgi:hypothetical protein
MDPAARVAVHCLDYVFINAMERFDQPRIGQADREKIAEIL